MRNHRPIACALAAAALSIFASGGAVAQATAWTYGPHPVIGASAHATVGREAIGLVCGTAGSDRGNPDIVGLRLTLGLVPTARHFPMVAFEGAEEMAGAPMQIRRRAAYWESYGNSCENAVANFQRSPAVLLADGMPVSFDQQSRTVEIGGREHRLPLGKDISGLPGVLRVPLTGAGAAIDRLIRACPALKRDIDNKCRL